MYAIRSYYGKIMLTDGVNSMRLGCVVEPRELKTKPTQQSVAKLREIGIAPHFIVCRCEHPLDKELRQKISSYNFV